MERKRKVSQVSVCCILPAKPLDRWTQSRVLDSLRENPSSIAVYRDPYHSLKSANQLFSRSPKLAYCIRRLWFNGFYGAETSTLIFSILRNCDALDYLTLPWTALRYGTAEDWSRLLCNNAHGKHLSSLELLAVDPKESQTGNPANQVDKKPLYNAEVDFGRLERLKIFGNSAFMALSDNDLVALARTAKNLRELHVTGTTSPITINGIMALAEASQGSLQILEYSPLSEDGFEHPNPASSHDERHVCQQILQCKRLRNLSISMPSLCEDLFSDTSVIWNGEVQIRGGNLCGEQVGLRDSPRALEQLWRILEQTRSLVTARRLDGAELTIELFIGEWDLVHLRHGKPILILVDHLIFDTRDLLVHGNFELGEILSDGLWPAESRPSRKGPYGQTGLYGKDEGPFSCVSEDCFADGLRRGYVSF